MQRLVPSAMKLNFVPASIISVSTSSHPGPKLGRLQSTLSRLRDSGSKTWQSTPDHDSQRNVEEKRVGRRRNPWILSCLSHPWPIRRSFFAVSCLVLSKHPRTNFARYYRAGMWGRELISFPLIPRITSSFRGELVLIIREIGHRKGGIRASKRF